MANCRGIDEIAALILAFNLIIELTIVGKTICYIAPFKKKSRGVISGE